MKKIIIAIFLSTSFFSLAAEAAKRVNGYHRSNGTYVAPHYRSNSNHSKFDNYSTRGNSNPYNGRRGYKDPYK